MLSVIDKILILTKQLYPRGRAFKMLEGGILEGLHNALKISEARAFDDAVSTLYAILPDNDNYTAEDATNAERYLGLITKLSVSLSDRKLAIARKINLPGLIKARQAWQYLEDQLQSAGFNVFVYENRFDNYPSGFITKTPYEVSGSSSIFTQLQYGQVRYGQQNYGQTYNNIIANSINEKDDLYFNYGTNLRKTFFIGGNPVGSFASVPAARHDEFRQLILKLKPLQTVGFLFINYT